MKNIFWDPCGGFLILQTALAESSAMIVIYVYSKIGTHLSVLEESIRSYEDILRHRSKFEALAKTSTVLEKQTMCSRTALSYDLYTKDRCYVRQVQVCETRLIDM